MKARHDIYPSFAQVAQALAHPKRVQLIVWLFQRPRTVDDLAGALGESKASTSAHLKVLDRAHLVLREKVGRNVFYRPASDDVARLFSALRAVVEAEVPEVREVLRDDREAEPGIVDRPFREVLAAIEAEAALALDVRPAEEHAEAHIPGARSVPFVGLEAALPGLPRDTPILVYCRGPYCPIARAAVRLLRTHGFDAVGLRAGLAEWRADHLPVAIGAP